VAQFDALQLLAADHVRMARLLADADLDASVIREVSMHVVADSRLLLPLIAERLADGEARAEALRAQDHRIEEVLVELEHAAAPAEAVDELRSLLDAHARDQEATFGEVRDLLAASELAHLGDEVARTLRDAPTHPHPHLPDHGFWEAPADAVASSLDHLRDAARPRRDTSR